MDWQKVAPGSETQRTLGVGASPTSFHLLVCSLPKSRRPWKTPTECFTLNQAAALLHLLCPMWYPLGESDMASGTRSVVTDLGSVSISFIIREDQKVTC